MAVKAPFNYIGNKYRIINSIQEFFPEQIDTFVDLFCGGCDVSINTQANRVYANDINYHVIGILLEFQKHDVEFILDYIDKTIEKWQLSKTNEMGYKSFRDHYNLTKNPLDLYVLMCFSFNYQFRFNSSHDFNNPFGRNRSSFNDVMRKNLILFKHQIDDITFSAVDFCDFDYDILNEGDFLYADPPYLLTCGSYNDGKRGFRGWTEQDDLDLMQILTQLSNRGVNFAMSNVLEHKGNENDALMDWIAENDYIVHDINFNYDNCSYHTSNRENTTREVLITNY
ncbi:MAG: Dam family site-specific DNA-(adenine-N6)-methyltransferase [Ruminococcus sp.]|nr:Dam family site-specific DNA-(adenine-N6)-methyltransferase [Ruminococcus sp.]